MNDFFDTRENEGRINWLNLNINDIVRGKKTIHFTENKYEAYDFDMTASTTYSYGEIKTIHRNYAQYPNFQIDYSKLNNLKEKATQDERIPYLVCFFEDYTIVWDISNIDLDKRKFTQYCTATTAFYNKGKKPKEEVWLSKEEAIYVLPKDL